jgi:hypothetical protein
VMALHEQPIEVFFYGVTSCQRHTSFS